MRDRISGELKEIEKLARSESYQEALRRADALAASYPDEPTVWATRGYVNGRNGDLSAAVSDLTRCIELRENEPNDFFARGRFFFQGRKIQRSDLGLYPCTSAL